MEDRDAVREIQNGNRQYLNLIAEKYYDDIFRFCVFRTGNHNDSYDLTQETFLRFIRYVDSYRYRNLKGYLLTIAMNVCRDYYRVGHKTMETETMHYGNEYDLDALPEEAASGERDRAETCLSLEPALKLLSAQQKEAVILHYIYELKFHEIALMTGAKVSTVKSRVKQGINKIREVLNREDFYET